MKLEEIKKVKIAYDEASVNAALDEGYVIKKIISSKTTLNGEGEEVTPCFILGKPK